jgi:hypothetical protein
MNDLAGYINELVEITDKLINSIEQASYEELALFSEERERLIILIADYQTALTEQHKQQLRRLNEYDGVILSRMNALKFEASDWLTKQGIIKEQKSAYVARYSAESMFFDRKK